MASGKNLTAAAAMLVLALLVCPGSGQEHAAAALAEPPVLVAAATSPLMAPAATGGGQEQALVGAAGPSSSSSSALAAPAAAPANPLLAVGEQLFSMGAIFPDLPKNIRDLLPKDLGAKAVDCVKRMVSKCVQLPTRSCLMHALVQCGVNKA
jgi:hypothetical protein